MIPFLSPLSLSLTFATKLEEKQVASHHQKEWLSSRTLGRSGREWRGRGSVEASQSHFSPCQVRSTL